MLKRNQENWSNCLTDQLHNEKAILKWNSTRTGNNGSICSPEQNINGDIAPLKTYSEPTLLAEAKKSLRIDALSVRSKFSKKEILDKSQIICGHFTDLKAYNSSENIAIYYPINNEVDTRQLFKKIILNGKSCFFPKIVNKELSFHKVSSLDELETGCYGIPEPRSSSDLISINDIDLFIVPGVSFDLKGSRLGYGKGYYDRALKDVSSSKIYAFCFSFQILNEVPSGNNDKPVGHIVSESGVVSTKI